MGTTIRDGATDLYRYFDADGRLLYVGISFSAVARAAQHRHDKGWWGQFATMTVERFNTRQEAAAAELEAIRTERPLHNVVGNQTSARAMVDGMIALAKPSRKCMALAKKNIIELVGMWSLTPPDNGEFPRVQHQVRIVGDLGDRFYLVQFYSWLDGEPTNTQVFHLSDMLRWKSYETRDAWLAACDIGMRANGLWAEGRLAT